MRRHAAFRVEDVKFKGSPSPGQLGYGDRAAIRCYCMSNSNEDGMDGHQLQCGFLQETAELPKLNSGSWEVQEAKSLSTLVVNTANMSRFSGRLRS